MTLILKGTRSVILEREVWTWEWNILLEVVMELLDYRRTPYPMVPRIEWYFSEFFLPKRILYQILDRNDFFGKSYNNKKYLCFNSRRQ